MARSQKGNQALQAKTYLIRASSSPKRSRPDKGFSLGIGVAQSRSGRDRVSLFIPGQPIHQRHEGIDVHVAAH